MLIKHLNKQINDLIKNFKQKLIIKNRYNFDLVLSLNLDVMLKLKLVKLRRYIKMQVC